MSSRYDYRNDELIDLFCHDFEAQFRYGRDKIRRVRRPKFSEIQSWINSQPSAYSSIITEDVDAVEIRIPVDQVDNLVKSSVNYLHDQMRKESRLRSEFPALQNAWEQYQTMLALVGGPEINYDKY
jgi:hypothetical protein